MILEAEAQNKSEKALQLPRRKLSRQSRQREKKWHLTLLITLPVIGHNYGWQTELPLQRLSPARQMMAEVRKQ